MWALLGSLVVVLALLQYAGVFLMTAGYAGAVPSGHQAVGLVVPLAMTVLAALMMAGVALILMLRGAVAPGAWGWAWLIASGAAVVALLVAWMDGRWPLWMPWLGFVVGAATPAAVALYLLRLLWGASALSAPMQTALWGLMLLSTLIGLSCGGVVAWRWWQLEQQNHARALAMQAERDAEQARRAALSGLDRLREDYAQHSPDTPLWVYISGLPEVVDPAERQFILARALQVPDFNGDLARTLAEAHPRFRHGAALLILHVAQVDPAWAPMLAQAIRRTAEELAREPDWMAPDEMHNPDPLAHLATLRAATQRFAPNAELDAALRALDAAQSARR